MKKHIAAILLRDGGFPPEIRIFKEGKALIDAGYQFSVLCIKRNPNDLEYEKLRNGIIVIRKDKPELSKLKLRFPTFFPRKKEYSAIITSFINEFQPDALMVHDIPFLPLLIRVIGNSLPIVPVLHENMPAAYWSYRANSSLINRLCIGVPEYLLWKYIEKKYLSKCTRVIVVVPEAAERFNKCIRDKHVVVSNTENEETFPVHNINKNFIEKYRKDWVVVYIGGIGPHRGIEDAIKASPICAEIIKNYKLLIVGCKDKNVKTYLNKQIRDVGADKFVELIDWVPSTLVQSYISVAKAGIIPHRNFEHTHTTVPHKLFQYMMLSKPVIVSDCKPLKRIVEETDSGVVFQADNYQSLARVVIKLYKQGDNYIQTLGANGLKAAYGKYSWNNDKKRLLNIFEDIFTS